MKVSIVCTLILCTSFYFSEGKGLPISDIPIPPINDGDYNIVSVADRLHVAALSNGGVGEDGRYVGPLTMKIKDGSMMQKFNFNVQPFYEGEHEHDIRLYQIATWGPNSFNVLQIELPMPNAYPIRATWEIEEVSQGQFLLRSHLNFDWGQRGEDFCLQTNGANQIASIVKCNRSNPTHLWNLELAD